MQGDNRCTSRTVRCHEKVINPYVAAYSDTVANRESAEVGRRDHGAGLEISIGLALTRRAAAMGETW